jgi:hypothetical protein
VKQDNKAKQDRGNEVSVEAPQGTCDLGQRRWKVRREGLTAGLDVGDKISHYCVLDEEAEVVERGRLKTTPALPDHVHTGREVGPLTFWTGRCGHLRLNRGISIGRRDNLRRPGLDVSRQRHF